MAKSKGVNVELSEVNVLPNEANAFNFLHLTANLKGAPVYVTVARLDKKQQDAGRVTPATQFRQARTKATNTVSINGRTSYRVVCETPSGVVGLSAIHYLGESKVTQGISLGDDDAFSGLI